MIVIIRIYVRKRANRVDRICKAFDNTVGLQAVSSVRDKNHTGCSDVTMKIIEIYNGFSDGKTRRFFT